MPSRSFPALPLHARRVPDCNVRACTHMGAHVASPAHVHTRGRGTAGLHVHHMCTHMGVQGRACKPNCCMCAQACADAAGTPQNRSLCPGHAGAQAAKPSTHPASPHVSPLPAPLGHLLCPTATGAAASLPQWAQSAGGGGDFGKIPPLQTPLLSPTAAVPRAQTPLARPQQGAAQDTPGLGREGTSPLRGSPPGTHVATAPPPSAGRLRPPGG